MKRLASSSSPIRATHTMLYATLALATLVVACQSGRSPKSRPSSGPAAAMPAAAAKASSRRPVFVRGPTDGNAVSPYVAQALKTGRATHHGVLVYVGATWCEPCQQFHHAVERGELDELLADVRLIEFDLDADREALTTAGYSSQLIPLFALPKDDGTASPDRIEGSIKGPSAVEQNLAPRLRAFLSGQAGG
jgi:thiol:disulfide interchange protein